MPTDLEYFHIKEILAEPHLSYVDDSLQKRKDVSRSILQKDTTDLLLIDSSGFLIDSVFAGLTEKHIEYIAKSAPSDYKKKLLKIQMDKEMMRGVFEIAKDMDSDLGKEVTNNQDRIKNIIQYIEDNRIAFEF